MTAQPTRFMSAVYLNHLSDFFTYSVHKLQLSVDEVAIICLVAAQNSRALVSDKNAMMHFGFEQAVLPNAQRFPVKLKFIYSTLGLNRETARRRLKNLVDRGLLLKSEGGFIFPEQREEFDYTRELREIITEKLFELTRLVKKLQPD